MKRWTNIKWAGAVLLMLFLAACGSGSDSASSGTGTLSLSLVDASDEKFKAVYVTIKEVQVCYETGFADGDEDATCQWETIATVEKTYNLLELVDGVMATLGQKNLEAGTYNQMRLILSGDQDSSSNILGKPHRYPQYLITNDNTEHEMKVPSGYQTGIKLVHPFEIIENLTTELILDFDAIRSVHYAGNPAASGNGKYILKPTIKVIGTHSKAVVSGLVTSDEETPLLPLENATVTAWRIDNGNLIQAASTQTVEDEDNEIAGYYTLYLDLGGELQLSPQEYLLVVTKSGYQWSCNKEGLLTVEVDQTYGGEDFTLSKATMVTVSGTVSGTIDLDTYALPEDEIAPTVHISFKQTGDCFPDPVETAYTDITDDADPETTEYDYDAVTGEFSYSYSIEVAQGDYTVEASYPVVNTTTSESETVSEVIDDFPATSDSNLDITFLP